VPGDGVSIRSLSLGAVDVRTEPPPAWCCSEVRGVLARPAGGRRGAGVIWTAVATDMAVGMGAAIILRCAFLEAAALIFRIFVLEIHVSGVSQQPGCHSKLRIPCFAESAEL
jgi:hypothetical protein